MIEQAQEDARGRQGVAGRPMALRIFNSKVIGERIKVVTVRIRDQATGEINRAELVVAQAVAGKDACDFSIQQWQIET